MNSESGYHVGVILDGNGRWAKMRGLARLAGHKAGLQNNIQRIIKSCPESNVSVLSLYAFAIANWKRDKEEVDGLWDIFRIFYKQELKEMIEFGARMQLIGDISGLPEDVQHMIRDAEEKSKNNTKVTVLIGLNYDGVDEVARATREIANKVQTGVLQVEAVTPEVIAAHLDTKHVQPPDIVIRTGMPQVENERGMAIWRSSSFLQLQSAQAVCVSTPVLWPDFSPEDLKAAIAFAKPDERLFGGQRV